MKAQLTPIYPLMCLIQVALIHSEGILAGEMKRSSPHLPPLCP